MAKKADHVCFVGLRIYIRICEDKLKFFYLLRHYTMNLLFEYNSEISVNYFLADTQLMSHPAQKILTQKKSFVSKLVFNEKKSCI